MEEQPKKLITRVFEFATIFALSAFLLRLGVAYSKEIWWILVIIAVVIAGAIALYRIWKNKAGW